MGMSFEKKERFRREVLAKAASGVVQSERTVDQRAVVNTAIVATPSRSGRVRREELNRNEPHRNMTRDEVANEFRVSVRTVTRWEQSDRTFPRGTPFGGKVLYQRCEVDRWAQSKFASRAS